MSNLHRILYVFVEGLDDERFFAHYFSVKNINRNLLRYYPLLSASNRCYFNGFQSG